MPGNKNLVTSRPETGENPEQKKSFIQKYGGSIVQMVFFWLIMKAVTGGKPRTNIYKSLFNQTVFFFFYM